MSASQSTPRSTGACQAWAQWAAQHGLDISEQDEVKLEFGNSFDHLKRALPSDVVDWFNKSNAPRGMKRKIWRALEQIVGRVDVGVTSMTTPTSAPVLGTAMTSARSASTPTNSVSEISPTTGAATTATISAEDEALLLAACEQLDFTPRKQSLTAKKHTRGSGARLMTASLGIFRNMGGHAGEGCVTVGKQTTTAAAKEIVRLCCLYSDVPFTSITVNKNSKYSLHVDKGNVGLSAIAGVGAFTGGELWVHEEPTTCSGGHRKGQCRCRFKEVRRRFVKFSGQDPHITMSFKGVRYTIVLYTLAYAVQHLNDLHGGVGDLRLLIDAGFRLPSIEEGRRLVAQYQEQQKDRTTSNKDRLAQAYDALIEDRGDADSRELIEIMSETEGEGGGAEDSSDDEGEEGGAVDDLMPISAELISEGMQLLGKERISSLKSPAQNGHGRAYRFAGQHVGSRTRVIVRDARTGSSDTVFGVILAVLPPPHIPARPEECLYLNLLLGLPNKSGRHDGHEEIRGVAQELDYSQLCKATSSFMVPANESDTWATVARMYTLSSKEALSEANRGYGDLKARFRKGADIFIQRGELSGNRKRNRKSSDSTRRRSRVEVEDTSEEMGGEKHGSGAEWGANQGHSVVDNTSNDESDGSVSEKGESKAKGKSKASRKVKSRVKAEGRAKASSQESQSIAQVYRESCDLCGMVFTEYTGPIGKMAHRQSCLGLRRADRNPSSSSASSPPLSRSSATSSSTSSFSSSASSSSSSSSSPTSTTKTPTTNKRGGEWMVEKVTRPWREDGWTVPEGWTVVAARRLDGKVDKAYISPGGAQTFNSKVKARKFMGMSK